MIHNFWLFALASFLLNITPGNDMLYVASRSAEQGVRAGIVSSLGIMAGCLVHLAAAAAGLSAIIVSSASAFSIIKYIGACYLIYLGMRALFNKKPAFGPIGPAAGGTVTGVTRVGVGPRGVEPVAVNYRRLFLQGVLTNVLNPKVALFFLAFLPQFIDVKGRQASEGILLLGIWFDVGGTLVNILVAFLFGSIGDWLRGHSRWMKVQEKITGLVLIALGIKVALTTKK
jgi:threonine/homoserine/homoserine lactone efflux protein